MLRGTVFASPAGEREGERERKRERLCVCVYGFIERDRYRYGGVGECLADLLCRQAPASPPNPYTLNPERSALNKTQLGVAVAVVRSLDV